MSNRRQQIRYGQWPIVAVAVIVVLWIGGRGSISAQTDTEHEAEQTLRDLKIDVTPDPNIAVPGMNKVPPIIVKQTVGPYI